MYKSWLVLKYHMLRNLGVQAKILGILRGLDDTRVTKYNLVFDFEGETEASVTVVLIFTTFSLTSQQILTPLHLEHEAFRFQ